MYVYIYILHNIQINIYKIILQFSIVECVISAALDEFVWLKKTALRASGFRVFMIILALLLGLPLVCSGGMQLLTLVDSSVSGFPLLFVGLIECVAINWVYGEFRVY